MRPGSSNKLFLGPMPKILGHLLAFGYVPGNSGGSDHFSIFIINRRLYGFDPYIPPLGVNQGLFNAFSLAGLHNLFVIVFVPLGQFLGARNRNPFCPRVPLWISRKPLQKVRLQPGIFRLYPSARPYQGILSRIAFCFINVC